MSELIIKKETVILIKAIVEEQLREMGIDPNEKLWLNTRETKEYLGDISTTQLYLLRSDPKHEIVFSQRNRKNILYLKSSLTAYIERHVR